MTWFEYDDLMRRKTGSPGDNGHWASVWFDLHDPSLANPATRLYWAETMMDVW
jgi:hypothetical protein